MESKKINQLATELTPSLSDLTIIGDPSTGISKKITLSQMASLFTGTVEEYANVAAFPLVGVADTIYIALDTNVLYRWDTGLTSYVELSPNIINSLVFSDANGFDGNISLVGSVATLTITTALTTGSVPFIGASGALSQDNANLFFDDTNNRLGINTNAPTTALDVFGSGIIGRLNGTSTNNAFLGFASAGTNKWSIGNVQSDHRFRIYNEATTSELVSVLQTGEFGIGIANPTTKIHIDGGANALIANLDANVSVAKSISFRSDNSNRINLEVSGTESGSNVGADLFIRTYTDAGSLIETPLSIVRSTGVTTIKSLTLTNALSISNGGTGSITQNFVDLTTTQSIGGVKSFSSNLNGTSAVFSSTIFMGTGSQVTTNGLLKLGIASGNAGAALQLLGWSGGTNWQIDTAYIGSGFNITPSTTSGGSTFTTPAFSLAGNGAATFSGTTAESVTFKTSNATTINIPLIYNNSTVVGYIGTQNGLMTGGGLGLGIRSETNMKFGIGGGTVALTIEGNGNMGFGVIPSAWGVGASYTGYQFKNASLYVRTGNPELYINNNAFYDGTNWKYISTGLAAKLEIVNKEFTFQSAESGSANSNATFVDRMKITSDGNQINYGNIFLNQTSVATVNANATSIGINGIYYMNRGSGSGLSHVILGNGGNVIGSISSNTTNAQFNTSSDYRLKEDLKDFDALKLLSDIKLYDFSWKLNNSRMYGVLAHELKEVIPYAVVGEKDDIDEEGNIKSQGVDYSLLTPILAKAIQELKAEINILKAK
jgi:hypothetical protein